MQNKKVWRYALLIVVTAVMVISSADVSVWAVTSTSNNYQLTETQFGGGSSLQSCSGQYCAQASIGDATIGRAESSSNTAQFGAITSSDPLLEVIVDVGESNLGTLSTETTATKTMTVKVRSYLSSGYILQIIGDPPKFDGHTLATPSSPMASQQGVEQFAINAVANTLPTIGANPLQIPSDDTSFGEVADNYKTPNQFMYSSEDVVARSNSESGRTDYTISMIVNISSGTPAGHYAGDFAAVVVPVY